MRLVFGLVLLAGFALAGGAVYMAKNYIGSYQQALASERAKSQQVIKTTPLFVVSRQIGYGEIITTEDIRPVTWPVDAVPEGSFGTLEEIFTKGESVPRVVLRAMEANEPLLAVKVTEPGEDAGITSRLARGMRAFTLRVDVASGVSGFLRPGDRVDVYWTGAVRSQTDRGSTQNEFTKLIEAGVSLIAIDQSAGGDLSEALIARTVTVSVSPQQVAALAQAQSTGRLSLSLVGSTDDTVAEAIEVDQNSLLGIVPEVKVEEKAVEVAQICTTVVRRGAERIETEIPCTN